GFNFGPRRYLRPCVAEGQIADSVNLAPKAPERRHVNREDHFYDRHAHEKVRPAGAHDLAPGALSIMAWSFMARINRTRYKLFLEASKGGPPLCGDRPRVPSFRAWTECPIE